MDLLPRDFINAHRMHNSVYSTGLHYSGITVYNQQIRTINLVYYLTKLGYSRKPLQLDSRQVVIVGGGISGLTAGLAFAKLGFPVSILEQKSLLLHLQHGCTTRRIHPNIYDWPRVNSLKPFTELPFANWTEGDASTVEKSLIEEFEKEKTKKEITLTDYFNVEKIKVKIQNKEIDFEHLDSTKSVGKETVQLRYSILLFATGFGYEKFVGRKEKAKSYWRNEDLSQLRLVDQVNQFVVSGMGDGGISDVCRLKLISFDPVVWATNFIHVNKGSKKLIDRLRKLETKARYLNKYMLSNAFERIYRDFKSEINKLFRNNSRSDIEEVVVNGSKPSIFDYLHLQRMSFLNAWLIFLLLKMELIVYKGGLDLAKKVVDSEIINESHNEMQSFRDETIEKLKHFFNDFSIRYPRESQSVLEKLETFDLDEYWTQMIRSHFVL